MLLKVAIVYNKKLIRQGDVINVFGAATKEHYNPRTIEKVARALEAGGHTVKIIEGGMNFIDEMKDFMPRVVAGDRPGMVFNMAYGIQGRNRYTHVPAMLEMLGIPYIGSGPEAHAVVQDKGMTKIVLQRNGIPTPGFWTFTSPDDKFDDLEFPVIVKPKMESTSMGMHVTDNWKDLKKAVSEQIKQYSQDILVEQFIPGREFAVGLLGNGTHVEILPIVEFDFHGDPSRIQTASDKLSHPVEKICPADLTPQQEKEIKKICMESYRKLGLNDFCRADIRMDASGNPYILELNSMASLGLSGSYVHAAKAAGYTYESLINKILEVAAFRYFGESHLQTATSKKQPLQATLRSYIRSHLAASERLLEQMVNVNSSVHNIEDVNKLGGIITKRLESMGFSSQRYHEFDVGDMIHLTNHDSRTSDILLLSHLDTWYDNRDFTPFHATGNKLFGSGIAESKGGLLTAVSALQALRFVKRLSKVKCDILLISDDSLGGKFSKKLVRDTSNRAKHVVDLKWGIPDGGIVTSCSGVTRYAIDMVYIHKHDDKNADVIPEMCKKIAAWRKISAKSADGRIVISNFAARTSFGRAPDYGRLALESRYARKSQGARYDSEIRKAAKSKNAIKLDTHVVQQAMRDPVEKTELNDKFYRNVLELAEQAEIKLEQKHRFATSSICDVTDRPVIGSMGPIGKDQRTPNEHILRDSIVDRALLLAMVIDKCGK